MRFRLRTLLIVLALGPPFLAGAWWTRQAHLARVRQAQFSKVIDQIEAILAPDTWDALGGPGSITGYSPNCFFLQSVDEPEIESDPQSEAN